MKRGVLYGIGVGPGDPELITVKGAKLLGSITHVFVPKPSQDSGSVALKIAKERVHPSAQIHELVFPMTTDKEKLYARWEQSARQILAVLDQGEDACFLTLGDAFLYSTYTYLLRSLRRLAPDVTVATVPGITAFSAAAALAEFPVGEAKEPVTIIPAADDLDAVRAALAVGGAVIIMKIGKRLGRILDILEQAGALGRSVFVSHVGMEDQRIVWDLKTLRGEMDESGYLSVIIVRGKGEKA